MSEEQKQQELKFPSEIIDLPSEGRLYPEGHPCKEGKIEIKYMTAKEEDILTSQNLIKKGVVIDRLLNSLILTKDVKADDLILGDKNAVMVAARILAYGPEYECEVKNPNKTGDTHKHTFNLADCPFVKPPKDVTENKFNFKLPASKVDITFKILSGADETRIDNEIKQVNKSGSAVSPELTTRLRYMVTSVNGDESQAVINNFAINMLSRDSLALRSEIQRVSPDIDMKQEIEIEGESVTVDIPMTVQFFWPDTQS